ncbi:hypothetical protein NQ314_014700 [Rhamnusium bicolor]|uniref:Uncharacterized protein n=1 Tax=Rhamnusium bicolor TaxID=1586634 RepID=A0AAV8X0T0_9CUCU|nr:hypothetical protein NQ314_014700 [Rhamnusium bicolor]
MPNLGVLLIPSYFYDAPFFTKFAINLMMRTLKSHPFIETTIQNFLWNITDPILDLAQKLAPNLVPTKNMGILDRIYADFVDNVTVYVGSGYGHRNFFLIDKYDGSEYLPHYGNKCIDKVVNSSEEDVKKYGVNAYKYDLTPSMFDRTIPSYDDCYQGIPKLPNGLSDASMCYFGIPVAASFPHYLYGDDVIKTYNTGIPLHGIARSQSNLVMKNMRGFNEKIQRFSDISIPLVWMEYNQVGIPWYIEWLIYFVVILVPTCQHIFTTFLICLGTCLIIFYTRKRKQSKSQLIKNKTLTFESTVFLKP